MKELARVGDEGVRVLMLKMARDRLKRFGKEAKAVWSVLKKHAEALQGRDWRHSWTAMSFSSVWLQKLSVAVANQTAIGAMD